VIASLAGTVVAVGPGAAVLAVGGSACACSSRPRRRPACPRWASGRSSSRTCSCGRTRTLYGFATAAELDLFERLLGGRGLAPAKALALLSGASVEALRAAVAGADIGALMRIPGVGRRLAAQLVLDLKDKLGPVAMEAGVDGEVLAWLTAMGFPPAAAPAAVAKLPPDASLPLEERVRRALAVLRPERA
jgi:holliday junction DNA helicase RuvA